MGVGSPKVALLQVTLVVKLRGAVHLVPEPYTTLAVPVKLHWARSAAHRV
jgi:hypothetical protein